MECPVCPDVTLAVSSREGVEIDYCPQCRGVWLDRGELDKVIDRVVGSQGEPGAATDPRELTPQRDRRYDQRMDTPRQDRYDLRERPTRDERDDGDHDPRRRRKKKTMSFLEDLFDFD